MELCRRVDPGGEASELREAALDPLHYLVRVLEDLDDFMCVAKANLGSDSLKGSHVHPHRLRKAADLWWKCKVWSAQGRSTLAQSEIQESLQNIMAEVFPEQVARLGSNGKYYCCGSRVRGQQIEKLNHVQEVFLWNPTVERGQKADVYTSVLKPTFCIPLKKSCANRTLVNVVVDSTLQEAGFVYGLARLLQLNDMYLQWAPVQRGALAADLLDAWAKAPGCHVGLTIYNCNDGAAMDPEVVTKLVETPTSSPLLDDV